MIEKCNECNNNKNIPVRENNRTFRIINDSMFYINKVKVDDCYIKSGLRCDYLFEIIEKDIVKKVFYVELKGKNIEHAIKQLEQTILYCKSIHKNISEKECHIIASRVPSANTKFQKLKSEFKRKNGVQLFNKNKEQIITV